jgi:hypothetical protein
MKQVIGLSWTPTSFWDRFVAHLHEGCTKSNLISVQMDLLAALPASIPLVLPSTTLAEVRHRSLPLYNRLQQLITEEDRHVWVFWNEQHRETATKVEYTAALQDEDEDENLEEADEEKEKPVTGVRTMESVNDRNDRGKMISSTNVTISVLTPRCSHPAHSPILRNPSHVPTQTPRIIPPSTPTTNRRSSQPNKSAGYGIICYVYARIRRWLAG